MVVSRGAVRPSPGRAVRDLLSAGCALLTLMGCGADSTAPASVPAAVPAWLEGWSLEDPRLSQPVYTESLLESLSIVADDGARIDAKVLRPVVPEGVKVPVILQLSPYLAPDIQPERSLVYAELHKSRFIERGYAFAMVSLRGFGASEGCPDYQGERDRQDANAIVDALASQPWSNGRVGGIGLSWDGTALNAAAVTGNPRLTTIVPNASITDWYKWSFMQGVPTWITGYTFNVYAPVAAGLVPGIVSGAQIPPAFSPPCLPSLGDAVLAQYRGALTGVRNDWWDERDLVRLAGRISPELAVLQVHGQRDEGVRVDMLHEWDALLRARLPHYRLLLGDWTHCWPDTPNAPGANNPDFPGFNVFPLQSWPVLLLRWFDHWLKGADTGIMALPGALIQDDAGRWRAQDALQPRDAQPLRLYPDATGGLAVQVPPSGTVAFLDLGLGVDPRGTCLYLAGLNRIGCYPVDLPTGQFFVTEPFTEDRHFSGIPRAHLRLNHGQLLGHVGVTLYRVSDGQWTALTYGIASYNTREQEQSYVLVSPGQTFEQAVELLARDFVIDAGQQLAVAIGAQVGRNPMGLSGNGFFPLPSGAVSQLLLGEGSWIELGRLPVAGDVLPLP